jgi:hypothetical protein
MSDIVLIVDGDLAIFRNAAVTEKRSIDVTHLKSGKVKSFKNRTEFKKFLSDKNFEYKELDYLIEDIQVAQEPVVAFGIIKKLFDNMSSYVNADRMEVYVGNDERTFRQDLPLPSPYKNNREGLVKPVNFKATKSYVRKHYGSSTFEGLETDDVVTIRCYEELAKGNIPILATLDKDAKQTQGVQLLDWTKNPFELELVPILGEPLVKVKTAVKGNGLRFLAWQVLAGDQTDTYKPYELSSVPYGATKAMNAVNEATTVAEVFDIIESEYKRLYPEEVNYIDHLGNYQSASWEDLLCLYWKCAYMKRSWDDPSDYWKYKDEQISKYS